MFTVVERNVWCTQHVVCRCILPLQTAVHLRNLHCNYWSEVISHCYSFSITIVSFPPGITLKLPKVETPIKVRVAILLGATDLQGKAYLTNMTQHNGESGCITCEEPGVIVAQGNGHTRCYPYKSSLERAPSHTTKTLLEQTLRASQTQKRVTFTSINRVCREKLS